MSGLPGFDLSIARDTEEFMADIEPTEEAIAEARQWKIDEVCKTDELLDMLDAWPKGRDRMLAILAEENGEFRDFICERFDAEILARAVDITRGRA